MEFRKKNVRENVLNILKEYPESRGDDKILLTYYWFLIDGVKFDGIQEFAASFKSATPEGTITRSRRFIQYDRRWTGERYLPDENISTMRKVYADHFKKTYGY